jgi:hypothetical protein
MRALWGALVLVGFGCGGAGGKAKASTSPYKAGVKVKITDGGQIYDALNTTGCVRWPNADVKKRAGRDGWKDFVPNSGLEGTVVTALAHCDGKTEVVLVAVGDYVVPVTSKGVEIPGAPQQDPVAQPPAYDDYGYGYDTYGYDSYGYGYDVYGGYYGGGGGGYGTGYGYGTTIYAGDVVQIVDASLVHTDLDQSDCITWPSDDVKSRGGSSAWSGYSPSSGETGVVLWTSPHCSNGSEILILEMDTGYIVPIESSGASVL